MRNTRTKKNTLSLYTEGRVFCIIDTETTGLSPVNDYIVEFSAKKYQVKKERLELLAEKVIFIRPPFPMPAKASSINGITDADLADKKSENEVVDEIAEFLQGMILVGYNVKFDIRMLQGMCDRTKTPLSCTGCLDVLEMARDLVSKKEVENHKLEVLTKYFGLELGLRFHSSLDDVEATARLLQVFYTMYKDEKDQDGGKERVYINYTYFWKGFRKEQSGIYVETNLGRLYFSTYKKEWCSSQIDIQQVDIDALEDDILVRFGITLEDFSKLTEKKYNMLKAEKRSAGVYI